MSNAREIHLEWCKRRALQYVDAGLLEQAVISMSSDLSTNEETRVPSELLWLGTMEIARGPDAVRRWIEGFR